MGDGINNLAKGRFASWMSFNLLTVSNRTQKADLLLRLAVMIYTAGLAISLLTRAGSAVGGIALMEWGVSHDQIFFTERVVAVGLLVLATSLLFYPTTFSLLFIGGVAFVEACAISRFGGEHFSDFALAAHAPRFMAPVALIFLMSINTSRGKNKKVLAAAWCLRLGLACVFLMHGLEARWHHPHFIDLIIGSMQNIFSLRTSEGAATSALTAIGVVDITIAIVLLIRPSGTLLAWMCFWGLITALSRTFAFGVASYPEVLVRASHFVAPVALWLLLARTRPSTGHAIASRS